MLWLSRSLREHPEVASLLVLALGHGLGSIRIELQAWSGAGRSYPIGWDSVPNPRGKGAFYEI